MGEEATAVEEDGITADTAVTGVRAGVKGICPIPPSPIQSVVSVKSSVPT